MNTPFPLVQEWFAAVEAPQGKRPEIFTASGHAPLLTATVWFGETLRRFADELAGGTTQ